MPRTKGKKPGKGGPSKLKGGKPMGVDKKTKAQKKKNKAQARHLEPTIPFDVYDNILLVGEGGLLPSFPFCLYPQLY
jgi:hypothetical protein